MNLSLDALATDGIESSENGPPTKVLKTEEGQEQQQEIDNDPLSFNLLNVDHLDVNNLDDELLNDSFLRESFNLGVQHSTESSQPNSKKFPLLSLDLSLFQRIGEFLSRNDVLELAQVNQCCLKSVSSQFNLELSLVDEDLTEGDFLHYFGKNGFYKEARCLDLFGSSFNPAWLKHLPKTLKALKLEKFNSNRFYEFGFQDRLAMLIEMARVLGETLPNLKSFSIIWGDRYEAFWNNTVNLNQSSSLVLWIKYLPKNLETLKLKCSACSTIEIIQELNHFRTLSKLDLSGSHFNYLAAESLAQSSSLKSLKILELDFSSIESAEAKALAQSPFLKSLEELQLVGNEIRDAGVQALAESPNLKSLKVLSVGVNEISAAGVRALAQSPYLESLNDLNLGGNRIGEAGAEALAQSPYLRALKELNLDGSSIGERGIQALAQSPNLKFLTYLGLRHEQIGDAGMLAQSPYLGSLKHLDLFQTQIGDAGIQALAGSQNLNSLEVLNLAKNEIEDIGAISLAQSILYLQSLKEHYLSENQIGDVGAQALANSPHGSYLSTLDLSDNEFGQVGLQALAFSPNLCLEIREEFEELLKTHWEQEALSRFIPIEPSYFFQFFPWSTPSTLPISY